MTDKQIIFKCDVDCIRKNTEECFELDCIKGQESILKQLQAKEQECEELKKQYNCYACDTCKGKEDYRNLKRHHIGLRKSFDELHKQLDQLKQTLTEIKDITEVEIECKTYEVENDCFNETRCKALNEHIGFLKQILQEISEVGDE